MQIRDRIKEFRRVPASELRPNPKNWRTHPKEQADALRGVLAEVGIADACIARELPDGSLMLVDGHLRTETLGSEMVPVLVLDVNEEEADKILATLDPLTAMAGLDNSKLQSLLDGLEFENEAIQQMIDSLEPIVLPEEPKEIIEDEVPEPPAEPVTKPGDLWILGEHRLLCGDSTNADDVERLMDGNLAAATVTDPPYNIDYGNNKSFKHKVRQIENDDMTGHEFQVFCFSFAKLIEKFCEGCIYCFGPPGPDGRIMFTVLDGLFHCSTTIIWNKDQFTLGRGKYQNKYEPCWFGWVKSGVFFQEDRTRTNVWDFDRPRRSEEHPTMKPVGLIAECILHSTTNGQIVFDPFLGSGTTLIAAEQLGRKCYGMEISPQYCDVIVKRWETFTGKKAQLCRSEKTTV